MKNIITEIKQILQEFDIHNLEDYLKKEPYELAEIYENMKIVQEEFGVSHEKMEELFESILGEEKA